MLVKDAMIRNVITVSRAASIRKLLDIFLLNRIDSLPVVDHDDILVGFVTLEEMAGMLMPRYKEILRDYAYLQDHGRIEQIFEAQSHLVEEENLILVEDFINPRFVTVKENDSLMTAAAVMQSNHLRRLPVINEKRRLTGIISQPDIILYLFTRKPRKIYSPITR